MVDFMSKKLAETKKQGWITLVSLVVIAVAVYIGFTPLFELIDGGVAGRVLGSSFGAIFVIVLTMFLLNKQTEIDQESKKSERVFDEQVKIYQQILDIARDMLMDGKLTKEEINRLPFPVIRLQMLGGDKTISSFQKVFQELNTVYASSDEDEVKIEEDDRTKIYRLLSEFAGVCRMDLGISDIEIEPEIMKKTIDSISMSGKKVRDYTKFSFNGIELAKNRYVYEIIKTYVHENPGITTEELQIVFPRSMKELPGGRKNIYEIWKTYDEALTLHQLKGRSRYFVSSKGFKDSTGKDLVLTLSDNEICVSNQWSLDNIIPFVKIMKEKGIRTE
tara:strand:+ start:494 stop:1492 length:999 start_codon:yes stop_codon:yes gene_type:complete